MQIKKTSKKNKIKYKFLSVIFIPLAILIKQVMANYPEFTEKIYSRGIYKFIMQPVSLLTGLLPFSVAELALILLVIYIPIRLIYLIIKASRKGKGIILLRFLANIVLIGSLWFFIQVMVWNINYERLPYAELANINIQDSSVDDLEALCRWLVADTNKLREQVSENQDGIMLVEGGYKSVLKRAYKGYEVIEQEYPFLGGKYGPPKPVLLSRLMSHSNIIGIYSCLTGEANIDIDIPEMSLASTVMHEMAHQRGFAREDEANYIAYKTCMAHPDIDFKYSGSVMALQYSMNALYAESPDRYFDVASNYSPGYRRDLEAEVKYWKQFQGITKEVANKMNDTYLKMNGQEDGVKSYGRMIDLLLAEYKSSYSMYKA
ncbi:MAG: DUF3810 domain-containing protein, partial [Clostridiaceae bacterium]|nr:DUF3810 domain-containing protein [Clostridiaceae bacterium]